MSPLLEFILRWIRLLLDKATDVVFFIYYEIIFRDFSHTRLPPIVDLGDDLRSSILTSSATELADMLKRRAVTSVQIVQAFQRRVGEINPLLNCVVDSRFDDALAEAREADRTIAAADDVEALFADKPFLGIPFTVKDCFAVKGMSWTVGLRYRARKKGDHDANCIRLMKEAGAIIVAITNVSELCLWMESNNKVYGRSLNPYHRGRIVGGSSGGEGCNLAAAGSVIGIGSDVGGSIRMPCFFNGVWGHKATSSSISNEGQLPLAHGSIDREMLATGPMCRYVDDLMPMMKVLVSDEGAAQRLQLDRHVDIKSLKVYYMEDDGGCPVVSPVHQDLKDAQARLVARLWSDHGIKAKKVSIREFYHSFRMWNAKMSSETAQPPMYVEMTPDGVEPASFPIGLETLKSLFGLSEHILPIALTALLEKYTQGKDPLLPVFVKKGDALRETLNELLGEDGILLYPSHSTAAPYHRQPVVKILNFSYTAVFNVTGNPVTQCPLGLGSWGVPLGIQVVGAHNMDRNTLAMAKEIDRMFGGWVPPS